MSLQAYKRHVWECGRCSNCKYVHTWKVKSQRFSKICPSSARYFFDAYSCQGKMDIARAIIDGELDYQDSPKLLEIIYRCTLCGGCDIMCKFSNDLEPLLIFEELRQKCIEDGKILPEHRAISQSVKNYDNVWMQPRLKRDRWSRGLEIKDISKERAEVLYFIGCTYSYKASLHKIPRMVARIFQEANVDFGILGSHEKCCGSPIARIGDKKLFSQIARENIERWNRLGIKKVITSCAGCYSTFKADYPKEGDMNFDVFHVVEYINQLIREEKLEFIKEVPLEVTWHDPCHLGRRGEPYIPWEGEEVKYGRYIPPKTLRRGTNGVYEPPRNILRSIPSLQLLEMERIKEYSWCCGSGGGVKSAFPDFALWSAVERVEEAKATGAEALVTSCPWCESNFADALTEGGGEMKLYSLVELVCQCLSIGSF